jgi:hypothetical protein
MRRVTMSPVRLNLLAVGFAFLSCSTLFAAPGDEKKPLPTKPPQILGALDNEGHFYLGLGDGETNSPVFFSLTNDGLARKNFGNNGMQYVLLPTPSPFHVPTLHKLAVAADGDLWLYYSFMPQKPDGEAKRAQHLASIFSDYPAPASREEYHAFNITKYEDTFLFYNLVNNINYEFIDLLITLDAFYILHYTEISNDGLVYEIRKFTLSGQADTKFGSNGAVRIKPEDFSYAYEKIKPDTYLRRENYQIESLGTNAKGEIVLDVELRLNFPSEESVEELGGGMAFEKARDSSSEGFDHFKSTLVMTSDGQLRSPTPLILLNENDYQTSELSLLDVKHYPSEEKTLALKVEVAGRKSSEPFNKIEIHRQEVDESVPIHTISCRKFLDSVAVKRRLNKKT